MEKTLTFTVNGQSKQVTTDPERPLLEVLREDCHLTGPKLGCGEGKCGACTVLINGRNLVSCITPVANVADQKVTTIEGLAAGEKLHPVQEAFLAEGAMQCGTCTPGTILSVVGLLNEKPRPTEAEILAHLEGHLCRCCGYPKILKAVKRAVAEARR